MDQTLLIAKRNNGIISTSEAERNGLHRTELTEYVSKGLLVKLERGIYALPNTPEDELYQIQLHCKRGIYSHETALFLLGFTDRVPFKYTLTVPKGYHSANVTENVVLLGTKENFYNLGITTAKTAYGHQVQIYCIERTLCDLMRGSYECDIQELLPAFKKYMKSNKRNHILLMEFAIKLHVAQKMRTWMEVYT